MSQMLAPYNSGMRIGTGFNSYTQQLCVNNAVVKENKDPATVADLRPQGTEELSQTVKWSGRFVENASDVLDSLDISGALSIKFGGGTQGAKGEGAYLKTSKIKDSQINYFLDVTVTNQRLLAADVTKFNAVPNCPKGQFTEVYGDSFISGFLEGGTFHALVSIKVDNNDDILKVRGALEVAFKAGPVDVNAQAKGAYESSKLTSGTSTTISVDWTGGGTLTQSNTKEWTIDALKAVAYAFPAKCAKYPQYTHAILTKYTALRSYQELANKGTPLDYENAGTYTKSLLESYLEYKQISSDIDAMAQRLQGNLYRYTENKSADPLLQSYAHEAAEEYDRQCRAFYYPDPPPVKAVKAITATTSAVVTVPNAELEKSTLELAKVDHEIIVAKRKLTAIIEQEKRFEPPLKPNALVLYPPTVLGFDRARRDCRWEMIKIVKEVDAVTNDPNVAIDPNRIWQYLHPTVFRQLLPSPDPPLPPYTPEWVAQEKKSLQDLADAANKRAAEAETTAANQATKLVNLENNLETSKKENTTLEKAMKGLETDKENLTRENLSFVVAIATADQLVKQREADLRIFKEAQPKTQQDLLDLQQKKDESDRMVSSLTTQNRDLDRDVKTHLATISTLNMKCSTFEEERTALSTRITNYEKSLDDVRTEKTGLETKLKEHETILTTNMVDNTKLIMEKTELARRISTLEEQISDLRLSTDQQKRGLDGMYSGKTVFILNVADRTTAWDADGRTDFGAETETSPFSPLGLRAKIMHTWTYDQNNVHQHFRLDRLDNGNWTIKSVAYDSYLEIYSSATTSHIYHRERGERADWAPKMQEWWINWSPGGLTFENAGCPGNFVDVMNIPARGPGTPLTMQPRSETDVRKLFTILLVTP